MEEKKENGGNPITKIYSLIITWLLSQDQRLMQKLKGMGFNIKYMKGHSESFTLWIIAIVVAGFIGFFLLFSAIIAPSLTIGSGTGSAGKVIVSSGTAGSTLNSCSAPGAGIERPQFAGYYNDPTNSFRPTQSPIAFGINVIDITSPKSIPVAGPTAGVAFTNGTTSCGDQIWIEWGENVGYYVEPVPGATNPITLTTISPSFTNPGLVKISQLSSPVFLSNGVVTVQSGVQTLLVTGDTVGQPTSPFTFQLKGGTYSYGAIIPGDYPSGTWATTLVYNSVAFKQGSWAISCNNVPGRLYTGPSARTISANTPTNYQAVTFEFPSSLLNYSAGPVCRVTGVATSAYTMNSGELTGYSTAAGGSNWLNIEINDKVLSQQGLSLVPSYLDPQLTTDLGNAQTTYTANVILG